MPSTLSIYRLPVSQRWMSVSADQFLLWIAVVNVITFDVKVTLMVKLNISTSEGSVTHQLMWLLCYSCSVALQELADYIGVWAIDLHL